MTVFNGGAGNDEFDGTQDADQAYGNDGDDLLFGAAGDDLLNGGAGFDRLDGSDGSDQVFGGAGDDVITEAGDNADAAAIDQLDGGDGYDVLSISAFSPVIVNLASGTFHYEGATTESTFRNFEQYKFEGRATITGTEQDDLIIADLANSSTASSLAVDAGGGNDRIQGGARDDTLHAGAGDDVMLPATGNDLLDGGEGYDTADFSTEPGFIPFYDLSKGVAVDLSLAGPQDTGRGRMTFVSIEHVAGTAHDDHLTGATSDDWLEGQAGADTLLGHAGHDYLLGGAGDDVITGGADRDSLYGGAGADRFVFASVADSSQGDGTDAVHDFESGADKIDLSAAPGGEVLIERVEGHSFVSFSPALAAGGGVSFGGIVLVDQAVQASDLLTAAGVHIVLRGGSLNETLAGGTGNDTIDGGSGDSLLSGGGGDDLIRGGGGRDSIYGGEGADTFFFRSAGDSSPGAKTDAIHDFQTGVDKIALPSEAGRSVLIEHNANGSSYVSFDAQFDALGGVSFAGIVLVDNAIGAGDIDAPGALIVERAAAGAGWTLPDQALAHDPLYIG